MSEPYLHKCMCCGHLTDHTYSYERPKDNPHHDEWRVDQLTLCSNCRREWERRLPPVVSFLREDEHTRIISNATKWLFEKVAKQLEKSHKKFMIKGFHHTEAQGRCCCISKYEAADLSEALIRFFDEYPTADEVIDAREVKENAVNGICAEN